ncbi:MAG: Gfo/Idh/MocA family oxidoreductase [Actinobacteria bacterium]|nr:Gfo/Idh/MocA family oxidoreductase [Actinomycetota bacterium]
MTVGQQRGEDVDGLGWAIVGASWIAEKFVIPAIRATPRSRVVGVFSSLGERGQAFAAKTGLDLVWTDLQSVLDDELVEAVFVGTLNHLHREQVLAAAAAGKHVLCEKPIALTVADAIEMKDACERAGVVLATNHAFRGQTAIQKMRAMINTGSIGRPLAARTFFGATLSGRFATWRLQDPRNGGVLYDLTVHSVDILRFLLTSNVIEVQATTDNQGLAAEGIEDIVTGTLRFESGTLSNFQDSYTVNHGLRSVEVHGTEGSLSGTGVLDVVPAGEVLLVRNGLPEAVKLGPLEGPFIRSIGDFTKAVRGQGAPTATADDGIRSLQAAMGAKRSARSGQRVLLNESTGDQEL